MCSNFHAESNLVMHVDYMWIANQVVNSHFFKYLIIYIVVACLFITSLQRYTTSINVNKTRSYAAITRNVIIKWLWLYEYWTITELRHAKRTTLSCRINLTLLSFYRYPLQHRTKIFHIFERLFVFPTPWNHEVTIQIIK